MKPKLLDPKIVSFGDGTYGIRWRILFWIKYLNLTCTELWWDKSNRSFSRDCKSSDLERVREIHKELLTRLNAEETIIE